MSNDDLASYISSTIENLVDAQTENIIDAMIVCAIAQMASEGVEAKDVYHYFESATYIAGKVKEDLYGGGFIRQKTND